MHNEFKRIVILGHNGFIGRHLIDFLTSKSPEIEIIGKSLPEIDLTLPEASGSLTQIFDKATAVIMFAGIKKQYGDNQDIFFKNLRMAVNVADVLASHPVKRFIYFSSAEVYGEDVDDIKINEHTPVKPSTYYGIAKYASECLLRKVAKHSGSTSLLIARPPLVYGNGDLSRGYGPSGFIWQAVNGGEIKLWGDGEELREFLFVNDLVRMVYDFIFCEYDGLVNLASGQSHAFREILDIIFEIAPFKLKISSSPRTKEKVNQGFSNEMLLRILPQMSFTSLREGVKIMFEAEYQRFKGSEKGVK